VTKLKPEITIVIPVRNERASIEATLNSILQQQLSLEFEVVVSEGGSTDGTRELLETFIETEPRLRIVDNPAKATPSALNRALEAARGRFFVRVDGHSLIEPHYVQRLVDHLLSGKCDGAGGRKKAIGQGDFGQAVAAAHDSRFGIGDSSYHFAGDVQYVDHVPFGAYQTERARRIGGWNERLIRNQDFDFDYRYVRAGGRLLLDPSIVVEWSVRDSPRRLARQYYEYGFWKAKVFIEHPASLHLRWLAPPALVGALTIAIACSWTIVGRWALALIAASYGVFLATGAVSLSRRTRVRLIPKLVLALATMHLAWGSGFLVGSTHAACQGLGRLLRLVPKDPSDRHDQSGLAT
jgi:succinoglycan biosynthesis protein ExoA